MPKWALAGAFGTPRLYLKSLLAERPRGAAQVVGRLGDALALGPSVDYWQPEFRFRFSPLVVYDNNINGGLPFDTIDLGPFRFSVDEDSIARAGITVGARATLSMDMALTQGLMFSASTQVGRRHSPRYNINVTDSSIGACLRYTADAWVYLDGCLSHSQLQTELGDSAALTRGLTLGRLFESKTGNHEISLTLLRQTQEERDQNKVRLASRNMLPGVGAFDLGVTVGEPVKGSLRQTFAVDFGYGVIALGKPTRISFGYIEETGGKFFGQDRSEKVWLARVSRNVGKNIRLFISYEDRASSIAVYSGDSWGVGLEYLGFRW